MTPQELADAVGVIVARAQERVGPGSIGAHQYHREGQPQKFETMPLDALLEYASEELLDQINYAVMALIRFDRLREALKSHDVEDAGRIVPSRTCPRCGGTGWQKKFGGLNGEIEKCHYCLGCGKIVGTDDDDEPTNAQRTTTIGELVTYAEENFLIVQRDGADSWEPLSTWLERHIVDESL